MPKEDGVWDVGHWDSCYWDTTFRGVAPTRRKRFRKRYKRTLMLTPEDLFIHNHQYELMLLVQYLRFKLEGEEMNVPVV